MNKFKDLIPFPTAETGTPKESRTQTALSKDFSTKQTDLMRYLAEMAKIVKKTISLSNQPPLSETDLGERAKIWMEVLEPIIPRESLPDALMRAIRNQKSDFPVNAMALKNAYEELVVEREQQKLNRKLHVYRCPKYDHDPKTAMMPVVNPFNFNEDILLPCGFCRPQDYEQARRDFINTSGEINPLDILNNVVNGDFGKEN